ncbi:winged helix-turn-helix domain-containing protein [Aquihabitans sp. McL0605]|uniref:winged helix-turn-helix domain-containing protein n=1 Tax=Aquihabitans sp. McL0605 TaxID=3415671 RepID=UPI003CED482B
MFDTTCVASDPLSTTMSWISTRGVETRGWPARGHGSAADPTDHPVLYLVDQGAEPPACSLLEDWIRLPLELDELIARTDRLIARSRRAGSVFTRVDEDDVLRVGDDMVVLSPLEARLLRPLIDSMGMLVTRDELIEAIWPEDVPADPRALDNRTKAVRQRIEGLPLRIHTVRGRGLLLERLTEEQVPEAG